MAASPRQSTMPSCAPSQAGYHVGATETLAGETTRAVGSAVQIGAVALWPRVIGEKVAVGWDTALS